MIPFGAIPVDLSIDGEFTCLFFGTEVSQLASIKTFKLKAKQNQDKENKDPAELTLIRSFDLDETFSKFAE